MSKYLEWAMRLVSDAVRSGLTGSLTFHFQGGKIKSVDRQEKHKPEI